MNEKIKYYKECYEAENARRKNVEQKASIYIGTLGVVGTILVNGLIRLVQMPQSMSPLLTFICIFFIVAITVCMSISSYHAIGAVLKKSIYYIDPTEIKDKYTDKDIEENLCKDYYKATIANYDTTNEKVDCMDSAQLWMRRAVVMIALFSLFLLAYYSIANYGPMCQSAISARIKLSEMNDFLILSALALSLVAIVLSIVALVKTNSLNNKSANLTNKPSAQVKTESTVPPIIDASKQCSGEKTPQEEKEE